VVFLKTTVVSVESGWGMGVKHIGVVAWGVGIAACVGLTAWSGISDVGTAAASVGAGMPLVVLTRVATVSSRRSLPPWSSVRSPMTSGSRPRSTTGSSWRTGKAFSAQRA